MPTELCWDPEHSGVTGNEDACTSLTVAQPALIDKHQQEQWEREQDKEWQTWFYLGVKRDRENKKGWLRMKDWDK